MACVRQSARGIWRTRRSPRCTPGRCAGREVAAGLAYPLGAHADGGTPTSLAPNAPEAAGVPGGGGAATEGGVAVLGHSPGTRTARTLSQHWPQPMATAASAASAAAAAAAAAAASAAAALDPRMSGPIDPAFYVHQALVNDYKSR